MVGGMKNTASRLAAELPVVDLYGPVHKGIRWALSGLLVRMGTTSFTERAETEAVLSELGSLLSLCIKHLEHEQAHLHPAIEARRPGATSDLSVEHEEHERSVADLRALAAALAAAPESARPALGRSLYLTFAYFVAETLAHMCNEEENAQRLLEELYTVDELHALHGELLASIRPGEMLAWLRIMLPSVTREQRAGMLAGAKASMPPEAFEAILETARPTLSADDWEDLSARLLAA